MMASMQSLEHIHAWLNRQYGAHTEVQRAKLADMERLPRVGGAYLLFFDIRQPLKVALRNRQPTVLSPGQYIYAGSANGPGGLGARVARHLEGTGKLHWHIDHVTGPNPPQCAFLIPDAAECSLVQGIRDEMAAIVPMPGFGASDCSSCESHFLLLPRNGRVPGL